MNLGLSLSIHDIMVSVRSIENMSPLEQQRLLYVPRLPNVFKAPFQVVEDDITARMSSSINQL